MPLSFLSRGSKPRWVVRPRPRGQKRRAAAPETPRARSQTGPCHRGARPRLSASNRCNGLQWKWLRTAINRNLGPDYLHLSIPSGRDYLPLRLLLSSWDCNRRRWDHITCDSPEPPSSACLYTRGSTCISRERLGGAPVSDISRPGTESVSSHLKTPS